MKFSSFSNIKQSMKVARFMGFIAFLTMTYAASDASTSQSLQRIHEHRVHEIYVLEDHAEKIAYGLVHGKSVVSESHALAATWPRVRNVLESHGAVRHDISANDAAIARLTLAVSRHQDPQTSANNVTRTLIPFFAVVGDKVPTYVHQLDYIGRQIVIDAAHGYWVQTKNDMRVFDGIWRYDKPIAAKIRGHERSTRMFDMASEEIHAGIRMRKIQVIQRGTKRIKNAVDLMENLYHR